MQWYTRTPARNPTISATMPVTVAVIPMTATVLREPTASVREKNGKHLRSVGHMHVFNVDNKENLKIE